MSTKPLTAAMLRELRHVERWGRPDDLENYGATHLAFWAREKVLSGLIARGLLVDAENVSDAGRDALQRVS